MHLKDTGQRAAGSTRWVFVAAFSRGARHACSSVAAMLAAWRAEVARDRERIQLASMSEREWSDLGLSKCDVVREIEKPGRIP